MNVHFDTVEFVILVTSILAYAGFRYRKDVRVWIGRGGIGFDTRPQDEPGLEVKPKKRRKRKRIAAQPPEEPR